MHLPVLSVEHDSEAETAMNWLFEEDHFSCPHFVIEMPSIEQLHNLFTKTPSLMKNHNLAHYVVILKKVSTNLEIQMRSIFDP